MRQEHMNWSLISQCRPHLYECWGGIFTARSIGYENNCKYKTNPGGRYYLGWRLNVISGNNDEQRGNSVIQE